MTFEPEFAEFMPETVTRKPESSKDFYAQGSFGAAVEVQCRVEASPMMVRAVDGREVVSHVRVYTAGPVGFELTDEITLPDGSKPPILRIDKVDDETGPHHEVVYV